MLAWSDSLGLEVESLADFDALVALSGRSMRGWRLQEIDLRGRDDVLMQLHPAGVIFLGCRFGDGLGDRMRAGGAFVFSGIPDVPFDPYRATLYDADSLYNSVATHP